MCGEFDLAEEMYREASERGFEPQPGMSLLRLAQGDLEAAGASIRRVAGEAKRRPGHERSCAAVLAALVEIMLAADDLEPARRAADELAEIAAGLPAPLLRALSAQAAGAVLLAEGEATAALVPLRDPWTVWQELQAPYEAERVRVLIARACQKLGDRDTARAHFEAARAGFERLGAVTDLSALTARAPRARRPWPRCPSARCRQGRCRDLDQHDGGLHGGLRRVHAALVCVLGVAEPGQRTTSKASSASGIASALELAVRMTTATARKPAS